MWSGHTRSPPLTVQERVARHATGSVVVESGLEAGCAWPSLYYDALLSNTDFSYPVVEIGVGFGGLMDRILSVSGRMYCGIDPYVASISDSWHFNAEVDALMDPLELDGVTSRTLQSKFDQLYDIVDAKTIGVDGQGALFRDTTRDSLGNFNTVLQTAMENLLYNSWSSTPPQTFFVDGQHTADAVLGDLSFIHSMSSGQSYFQVFLDDSFSAVHTEVAAAIATFLASDNGSRYTSRSLACAGDYSMTALEYIS
jgi:hypothetical protein